jgi:two-component sensor histidine kinase
MLHQIGNDLSISDSFDELCRQAVIRGRQLLECQRLSIWLRKENSMTVSGSYGVDEKGQVRDERAQLLTAGRTSPMGEVLNNKQPVWIKNDIELRNDKGDAVGKGAQVVAALWNGSQVIGCICADNLLDKKPFTETDLDILRNYAAVIGHVASRKKVEDNLKKSLKEREILSQEINYRVDNNFKVILSLLNLQSAYIRDTQDKELFRQTQTRIRCMAKVHEIFRRSEDLTRINIHDYIMEVIQDLFQVYKIDPASVIIRWAGHHETFSLSQAIPCSLIINELVTNALKHGLKRVKSNGGQPKGELSIAIRRDDQRLAISIGNDGIPFPSEIDIHRPFSLGLQLVNALVSQLNGSLVLDRSRGTIFTFSFPENAAAQPPGLK